MKNQIFNFFLIFSLITFSSNVWSEEATVKVVVELNTETKTFEMSESGKIYFSNNVMMIEPSSESSVSNGQISLSSIKKLLFVGLESVNGNEVVNADQFFLYPNPAKGYVSLKTPNGGKYRFVIYSLGGEIVKNGEVESDGEIDVTSLSSGVYFFNIGNVYIKFRKI